MKCLTPDNMQPFIQALGECTENSCILAGGTDCIIKLRKNNVEPDLIVYLGQVPELQEITLTEESLRIGSMVTMACLSETEKLPVEFRAIADAAGGVGSPQIRNKATIGGNLCSASPAGDLLPVMWMYEAEVEILNCSGELYRLPIGQFLLGPGKTALQHGEAVTAVVFPRVKGALSAFRKIGFREHVSIARESAAGMLVIDESGKVAEARLSLGAVSTTPIRIADAEALLLGQELKEEIIDVLWPTVAEAVHGHCRPINRNYKTEAAHGLTAELLTALITLV